MSDLREYKFGTANGEEVLVLDEYAIDQLKLALTTMQIPPPRRRDILSGREAIPPLLHNRFKKMMQKRLGGESPIRVKASDVTPVRAGYEVVGPTEVHGRKTRRPTRGRAMAMSIEEQLEAKRARKVREEEQGRAYRDVIPVPVGPRMGSQKGESTSHIFASGSYRGTNYIIEEISAPIPLPKNMPATASGRRRVQEAAVAPYRWQARVISHPWTRQTRAGFSDPRGPLGGGTTSGQSLASRFRTGELTKQEFPVFSGKNGWVQAVEDVEKAINRSYEYRVERGDIPPELEPLVGEEKEKVRTRGKTPSLAPRTREGSSGTVRRRREGRAMPAKSKNPRNPRNPTSDVHQELGEGFLAESEKLWDSYCKTGSHKTLLDAYRVLVLACQEFEYTGDKKRLEQAGEGIRAASGEILGSMKKAPKKKVAKKKAKKATKKVAKKKPKKKPSKKSVEK